MTSDIFDQWRSDWKNNRMLFNLELLGVSSSIKAAVLISFFPTAIPLKYVFILWLIGSISLSITSWMRSNAWPMLLMFIYTVLNMIGLINTI